MESIKVGLRGVHLLLQEMHGHLKRALADKNSTRAFSRLREAVSLGGERQGREGDGMYICSGWLRRRW